MDRRRTSQGSPEDDDRARKRRKQSNESPTAKSEMQVLFDAIWNHQERKRNIRLQFEVLPSQELFPDYYEKILNPISLEEIKIKLDGNEYSGVESFKKDILLMADNATIYNKAKSQVANDALRIRNIVETFGSSTASTPIKQDFSHAQTPFKSSSKSRHVPAALRDAQVRIIDELGKLTDDNGEEISYHFRTLPPRKQYPDYYKVIKQPVSLNSIRTRAKEGNFRTWADFEDTFLLIRRNAEEYNDAASDIVKDARALEEHFYVILDEEKSKLGDQTPAPSGLKIRLNMGTQRTPANAPKIKLNVGARQSAQSPEMLAVQKPSPKANGTTAQTRPPAPEPDSPPPDTPQDLENPRVRTRQAQAPVAAAPPLNQSATSMPSTPTPAMNGVNNHAQAGGTITVRPRSQTPQSQPSQMSPPAPSMPPPNHRTSVTPRPPSYSPVPSISASPAPPPTSAPQPYYHPAASEDMRLRTEAPLIREIIVTSASTTNEPYLQNLRPDPQLCTTQFYLYIPVEFQSIILTPALAPDLKEGLYQLTVEHKFHNSHQPQVRAVTPNPKKDQYELRLGIGSSNEVDCRIVAPNPSGGPQRWIMERFRIFIVVAA